MLRSPDDVPVPPMLNRVPRAGTEVVQPVSGRRGTIAGDAGLNAMNQRLVRVDWRGWRYQDVVLLSTLTLYAPPPPALGEPSDLGEDDMRRPNRDRDPDDTFFPMGSDD